jgi:hypothetical protein
MKTSLRPAATPSPQRRSRPRVNDRPYPKTRSSGQHPRRQFLRLAVGAGALPGRRNRQVGQGDPGRQYQARVSEPFSETSGGTS